MKRKKPGQKQVVTSQAEASKIMNLNKLKELIADLYRTKKKQGKGNVFYY